MMLCVTLAANLLTSHMIWNLYDYIDWGYEARDQAPGTVVVSPQKAQNRRLRGYMEGFLFVSMIKIVLNPYPTLHDFSVLGFLMFMNIRFLINYVEALLLGVFALIYGMSNTWLLGITWLHRFSGNANFIYFQIVALDVTCVLLFLFAFNGVDAKRKKYAKELLEKKGEPPAS